MTALLGAAASSARAEVVRVPIVFHVAREADQPVAPDAFVEQQLAQANAIFRPLGIEFISRARQPLARGPLRVRTRRDRDALARHLVRGAINCFVVAALMDVDEPGRERRGVHWHVRSAPERHFVIVSKIAGPYVLAHELAHFFGNPQHSETAGNLLSYTRTETVPFLDAQQVRRVHARLSALLTRGELETSARE